MNGNGLVRSPRPCGDRAAVRMGRQSTGTRGPRRSSNSPWSRRIPRIRSWRSGGIWPSIQSGDIPLRICTIDGHFLTCRSYALEVGGFPLDCSSELKGRGRVDINLLRPQVARCPTRKWHGFRLRLAQLGRLRHETLAAPLAAPKVANLPTTLQHGGFGSYHFIGAY